MKKHYTFEVTQPRYSGNEFQDIFKYEKSWEGKIKIEYKTKRCIIATASAKGTRFDISLTKYWVGKDGSCEYGFVITNWSDGVGGILSRSYTFTNYNYGKLDKIWNKVDRLSATYALGKLMEIIEKE